MSMQSDRESGLRVCITIYIRAYSMITTLTQYRGDQVS